MHNQSRRPSDLHDPTSVLSYDIETVSSATRPDGSFPPWPTHIPVAAGFAKAELADGGWEFQLATVVRQDGQEADFYREVDEQLGSARTTTSYNGRQFDSLVLRLSALRDREYELPALATHAASNRFGSDHADLADLFIGYAGRKVSLADICRQVGIPVKTSVSGGDVAELWQAGEVERVRNYVLEDAVATLILFFMWSAFRAADETLITRPLAALARHIQTTSGLEHLSPFVTCDLTQWARPRALQAKVHAASERVQAKLRRAEEERHFVAPGFSMPRLA